MMIKPVFLWTDILVWAFVACVFIFYRKKRHSPLIKTLNATIFGRSRYVIAFLIIFSFVSVGLLDSIHYKVQNEIRGTRSVLDLILSPRNVERERTYSAPFSLISFSKEIEISSENKITEVYLPLKYAGQALENPQDKNNDILIRSLFGLMIALIITLGLYWLTNNRFIFRKSSVKKTFWITTFIIISFISVTLSLMFEYHVLGTDKVGRDVLYMGLKSIRTGLVIGTVTSFVMLPFALMFGIWAGYFRGWVDDLIQYLYSTLGSIPGILLIAAAVLSFQVKIEEDPDLKLLMLCIILGATGWIGLCRLLRGETLKLREMEFVLAARALGVKNFKIILNHIVPNLMHIVIISLVLDFSGLVLAESVLSYIGVGVTPNTYSWGNMINAARLEMAREPMVWWSVTTAFIFMFTLVFATNVLGDAVQQALNPKERQDLS